MSKRCAPSRLEVTAALLLVLGCVLVGAAGCSGTAADPAAQEAEAPSFAPIEFHRGAALANTRDERQERRDVAEDAAGWQEKLDLARTYAAGGYDEQALQVLDGALALGPPTEWAQRLRGLRTSLHVRRAEETLLRVDARGVKDYVPFERDVDFVIRLRNISGEVITLLAPPVQGAVASPSALLLEITRRDRDIHATQLGRTWNQTVYVQQPGGPPIRILPGEVHELPVRIPAEDAGPSIAGLRTLEVRGTFRPTRLRRGDERRRIQLPIRGGRVIVLPQGFEPLAADPLGSMEKALTTVAPAHLLVATEFVPPRRRAEAVAILARALGEGDGALYRASLGGLGLLRERAVGDRLAPLVAPLMVQLERTPERAEALVEGLSTLTGVRLAPDVRLWQDWWRREEGRSTAVSATEER